MTLGTSSRTNGPFIGPRAFEREDRQIFFGRDNETDRIGSLIFAHRLVLIYAQSGACKTSIFNAQVIPSLEQCDYSILPIARVKMASRILMESNSKTGVKVSDISNIYIFNALQSLNNTIKPDSILNKSLLEFLNEQFPPTMDERGDLIPQILIFDQFEELFNLIIDDRWAEQQKDFFNQISHTLIKNALLRIVFVIWEDYVAHLDPFKEILPEKLRARFRLERLSEEEAIEAIEKPLVKSKEYFKDYVIIYKIEVLFCCGVLHAYSISQTFVLVKQCDHLDPRFSVNIISLEVLQNHGSGLILRILLSMVLRFLGFGSKLEKITGLKKC
jgi:hypothetical protein